MGGPPTRFRPRTQNRAGKRIEGDMSSNSLTFSLLDITSLGWPSIDELLHETLPEFKIATLLAVARLRFPQTPRENVHVRDSELNAHARRGERCDSV